MAPLSDLVFEDELGSQQGVPRPLTLLHDGVPQQLGGLVPSGVELHQGREHRPAQQLIVTLDDTTNNATSHSCRKASTRI